MKKQLTLLVVILLLNFSAPLVQAQGLDGTLRGEVKDQGGAVVVGAKVTVTSEQTDLNRTQGSTSQIFSLALTQLSLNTKASRSMCSRVLRSRQTRSRRSLHNWNWAY